MDWQAMTEAKRHSHKQEGQDKRYNDPFKNSKWNDGEAKGNNPKTPGHSRAW
jgi:hypothetical protein